MASVASLSLNLFKLEFHISEIRALKVCYSIELICIKSFAARGKQRNLCYNAFIPKHGSAL